MPSRAPSRVRGGEPLSKRREACFPGIPESENRQADAREERALPRCFDSVRPETESTGRIGTAQLQAQNPGGIGYGRENKSHAFAVEARLLRH